MDAVRDRMLEFYSVHRVRSHRSMRRSSAAGNRFACARVALCAVARAGCCVAGCATAPPAGRRTRRRRRAAAPTAPPLPRYVEPPPPAVNLSGFPLPYRRATPTAARARAAPSGRTPTRFGADGNYRTGWQDGLALCSKK